MTFIQDATKSGWFKSEEQLQHALQVIEQKQILVK